MGYLTGLASVQELLDSKNKGFDDSDRPKTKWLSLKKSGDSAKIVFAQELDKGAQNYSEKNGLGRFVLEHSNPENWQKKAVCTKQEEGKCYGCEKGWNQKVTLYINVIVDDGSADAPYVAIFSRGLGKGSVAKLLLEFAAEDETVTDKWFRFKREGEKKETTYLLMPSKAHDLDLESFELFDLDRVPFTVSYDRQEAYYLDGQEPAAAQGEAPARSGGSSTPDAEW